MKNYELLNEASLDGHPEAKEFHRQINWEILTDLKELEDKEAELKKNLAEYAFTEDQIYWISLGFHEAATNAIVHANMHEKKQGDDDRKYAARIAAKTQIDAIRNKKVRVIISLSKDGVSFDIQDEGGEEGKKMLLELVDEDPLNKGLYKSAGRGNLIMENIFDPDSVRYEFNDLGTRVTMTKTKKSPEK